MALIDELKTVSKSLIDASNEEASKIEVDSKGEIVSKGDDISQKLIKTLSEGIASACKNSLNSAKVSTLVYNGPTTAPVGVVTGTVLSTIAVIDASPGTDELISDLEHVFNLVMNYTDEGQIVQTVSTLMAFAFIKFTSSAKVTDNIAGTTLLPSGVPSPVSATASGKILSSVNLDIADCVFTPDEGNEDTFARLLGDKLLQFWKSSNVVSVGDAPHTGLTAVGTIEIIT